MGKDIVLGVKCGGNPNGNGHDCNVAIKGKGIITAIQAERLDRIKKSSGWKKGTKNYYKKDITSEDFVGSKLCIEYCMKNISMKCKDIDLIVVDDLGDRQSQINEMHKYLKKDIRIVRVSHHLAHAASTFFCSPFEEAAIVVVDGGGGRRKNKLSGEYEYERQSFYLGTNNNIELLHTTWSNKKEIWGLGGAYAAHQQILGLEAGKVMGLAPYGKGELYNDFKIFKRLSDIDVLIYDTIIYDDNLENFNINKNNNIYNLLRDWDDNPLDQKWADMAYKIQSEIEEEMIYLCNELYRKTSVENLCIAGGVGLNSVANKKILDNTPFKNIFIQPAADDGGIGFGCALYGYHTVLGHTRDYVMTNAYLGKIYSEDIIINTLNSYKNKIIWTYSNNIISTTAKYIADGLIIGWFQGASEYGPRALGNRSIICDPRSINLKNKINLKIKGREFWRPLAPSIMLEYVNDFFDIKEESPFMLLVANAKIDKLDVIPAVIHVDNTARVQTINRDQNKVYYDLINEFYKLTGIPLILNTSFNLNNEPIVETPEDAVDTFIRAKQMDILVIHNYIITRL
ncbi:MAG: hypothetical protein E7255_10800 [Lachnospiraceae bacterium]|nr:hypothetical protein [Lachnospiraceae bacterium]